jgi:hypothetical protein
MQHQVVCSLGHGAKRAKYKDLEQVVTKHAAKPNANPCHSLTRITTRPRRPALSHSISTFTTLH